MAWKTRGAAKAALPRHDHDLGAMNALKSPTCARCKLNAAESGIEIHTCAHGGAFGRRDMTCRRCRQLAEGVNIDTSLGSRLKRKAADLAQRNKEINEHDFDACQRKNVVCTCFDW